MVQALSLQTSGGFVRVQSSQSQKASQRNMAEALLMKRTLTSQGPEGCLALAEQALNLYR